MLSASRFLKDAVHPTHPRNPTRESAVARLSHKPRILSTNYCKTQIVKQLDKRSGLTYVYESKSVWDKELKQSRSTRRLIGRLDPNTGDVIETDGRRRGGKPLGETSVPVKEAPNKHIAIQQIIPVERKFCGATYLFDAISDKLGLTSDLKSCFPATYKMILSIAYYLILEDSAIPLWKMVVFAHSSVRKGYTIPA